MKRKLWPVVGALLLVILFGAFGCDSGFLAPPSTTQSGGAGISSQQNTGIWVTGEGKVTLVPDVAILSVGVESQADTVAEAQNRAAVAMDAVFKALQNGGVADKDIQTRQFSVYPVRRWVEERSEEELIGYRVTNTVTAKIRKVETAGDIIDAVTRAGGDNIRINDISFTVDDPKAYQDALRKNAMNDALSKAQQLADAGKVKLGKPVYINEMGGGTPGPIFRAEAPAPTAGGMPVTPVSPGETELTLTVQVVYAIN